MKVDAGTTPGRIRALVLGVVALTAAAWLVGLSDRGEHELRGVPGTWRLL